MIMEETLEQSHADWVITALTASEMSCKYLGLHGVKRKNITKRFFF